MKRVAFGDELNLPKTYEPSPLAGDIYTTWFGTALFSLSLNGVLAYRAQPPLQNLQLTWFDRQGNVVSTAGPPGSDDEVVLSPDGRRASIRDAAYDVSGDLWTIDFDTGRRTRLTFRKDNYSPGIWSSDGSRIAFAGGNLGDTLYETSSAGGDTRALFQEPGRRHYVTSWSRDGRFLLYYTENTPKTGADVWVLPLQGDRKPVLLLGEAFNEWAAVFSPDMRWIAYASTELGISQVFVRPLKISAAGIPSLGEGKWQISNGRANWPRWRFPNEIVFNTMPGGHTIFAVPVKTTGEVFESGVPRKLFVASTEVGTVRGWDVSPDGQRFVVAVPHMERTAEDLIHVVINWPALSKK